MNPVGLFWKTQKAAISVALRRTAEHIKINMRELILARLTPSGGPQKGASDLIGTGVLSSPSRYKIVKKGLWEYAIYPPKNRAIAIEELRKKGYELFEIPYNAAEWLDEHLQEELNK